SGITMRDGTILIDADTYYSRGLAKDARYRVFNADEIAGMIATTRNAKVLDRLKQRREGIAKSVYAVPPQSNAAPVGHETKQEEEPAAPGAVTSAASVAPTKAQDKQSLARRYA